jgi:hypothetical protein
LLLDFDGQSYGELESLAGCDDDVLLAKAAKTWGLRLDGVTAWSQAGRVVAKIVATDGDGGCASTGELNERVWNNSALRINDIACDHAGNVWRRNLRQELWGIGNDEQTACGPFEGKEQKSMALGHTRARHS